MLTYNNRKETTELSAPRVICIQPLVEQSLGYEDAHGILIFLYNPQEYWKHHDQVYGFQFSQCLTLILLVYQ